MRAIFIIPVRRISSPKNGHNNKNNIKINKMRYKLQNNETILVEEKWTVDDYCKKLVDKNESDNARALYAIEFFLKCFPRFKEVIISTETDNEQDNHTQRDDQ